MRLFAFAAAILLAFPLPVYAQAATFASLNGKTGLSVGRYDIDVPHSAVDFSVKFMGLSTVRGAFSDFSGTIMFDSVDVTRSSVAVVIHVASINTNSALRDRDLKSENFFDVAKFPRITFVSTAVARVADGFIARGPLTIHGVTKDVAIPFTRLHPLSKDAWGNLRMGFVGRTTLNRKDYGVLGTKFWNSEYDPGRMSISDEVDVELTVEAELANVDTWTVPRADSLRQAAQRDGLAAVLAAFRIAAADSASLLRQQSAVMLHNAGVKYMHHGEYANAADVYRVATDLNPNESRLQSAFGEASLMAGRREQAMQAFRRAVQLDADNTVASEYLKRLK